MAEIQFNAPGEREKSLWLIKKENDPGHSQWYIERFKQMEAEGNDLGGESRVLDAMASRGAKILDAGCGPGRVGKQLHALGHRVTGVDIDPELIDGATRVCPEASWVTADLADLPQALGFNGEAGQDGFELLVCSGNVMGFLARSTRYPVVENFYRVLAPGGRAVVGYGSGPGRDYSFEQFLADARQAGFNVDATYSTWDLRPFTEDSEYLVAVLSRAK